jgi:hypothetical protein
MTAHGKFYITQSIREAIGILNLVLTELEMLLPEENIQKVRHHRIGKEDLF